MPLPYTSSCDEIRRELASLGVGVDRPDFLNNPRLIAYVGEVPTILNNYARYVNCRQYSESYLRYAEHVVRTVAEVIYEELVREGRRGACIDASGVMSQILESEGVWSYQASGSMTMTFPTESGIPNLYNYSYNVTDLNFSAGHSWLVAPPFAVVDVTIGLQAHEAVDERVNAYLPSYIMQKEVSSADFDVTDISSPAYLAAAAAHGVSLRELRAGLRENFREFSSVFPTTSLVTDRGVEVKYIPLGINNMDGTLEENRSLCLSGNFGATIYEELVKPRLSDEGVTRSGEST
jgi:hypothetical protein